MKQTILHINIHGNHSDVGSHHQHKPGCRCWLAPGARRCVTAVWDSRDTHPGWTRCCCRSRGRAVLCWLTLIIKKITFLLGPSHTKRQVFSPPLSLSAPSSFFFFFFPSAAHNSEHHDGCPEALEWIQWTGQDSSSPLCTFLNIALVSTVRLWEMKAPPPPSFFRQEAKWLRVFPSLFFCLSWFPYFISYRLFQVKEVPLWCNTSGFFFVCSAATVTCGQFFSPTGWATCTLLTAASYFGTPWLAGGLTRWPTCCLAHF